MTEVSSKKIDMEKHLQILNDIQRVEAPDGLYEKVMGEINERKIIPLRWLSVAAAVFLALVSADLYVVMKDSPSAQQNNTVEVLAPLPNNMLYND